MTEENNDTRTFIYATYIKTTPEKLWQALTDGDFSVKYWGGFRVESNWKVGSPIYMRNPAFMDGKGDFEGKILACDPPRRLTYTFGNPSDHRTARGMGPSEVTYELTPVGPLVKLTLTHENLLPEDLDNRALTLKGINNGWPAIVSSLKSLLETGQPLTYEILMAEFEQKAPRLEA